MSRTIVIAICGAIWGTLGCERDNPNYLGDMAGVLPDLTSKVDMANGPLCGQTAGMARVTGGTFKMGADGVDDKDNTKPVHTQTVAMFWMDQTELTIADYAKCVAVGACSPPFGREASQHCNWGVSGKEQHPVNCVDFYQATAYCAWQCKRLPTEIEWEYAARGSVSSLYPWGNDLPNTMGKEQTKLCWNKGDGTCPVRTYIQSETLLGSPTGGGLYDMAGNVWEWTTSYFSCKYALDPKNPTDPSKCGVISDTSSRVTRSGSWYNDVSLDVRSVTRNPYGPASRDIFVGFRCLRAE